MSETTETETNGPNAAALREIVPMLRELEAAERFWMDMWAGGEVTPDATDWHECGTTFCMAGAKAVFDGWRPQYELREIVTPDGIVERPVASGRFVRPEDRHDTAYHRGYTAYEIAREAFGLTTNQAIFLFHAAHITRVDDLVTRIDYVIAHPDDILPQESFPLAARDVEYAHAAEDGKRSLRIRRKVEFVT